MCLRVTEPGTFEVEGWVRAWKPVKPGRKPGEVRSPYLNYYHWKGGWNHPGGRLTPYQVDRMQRWEAAYWSEVVGDQRYKDFLHTHNREVYANIKTGRISFNGGVLHLCATASMAREIGDYWKAEYILPVWVRSQDLVAWGNDEELVATKVWVEKKDKDKIVRAMRRNKEWVEATG